MVTKIKKFIYCLVVILFFISFMYEYSFSKNDEKNSKDIDTYEVDYSIIEKNKNYNIIIPPVLKLDYRTSLNRYEINEIDTKKLDNILHCEIIFKKVIQTIGLKYNDVWVDKLKNVASQIKKYKNVIIVIEGYRNTELTFKENLNLSKENALFVAKVLKEKYKITNTMAVIGRGIEKNEDFDYNSVIITLIQDINPSDSIY